MIKTAEKIEYITESDALFMLELKERLDITEEDIDKGEIQDFFCCDPDYIKFRKCDGRGQTPFVIVTEGKTTYIITPYEIEPDEKEIVDWFLAGSENELDIENTWQDWKNVNQGIAYRGGSGYCYGLYAKS